MKTYDELMEEFDKDSDIDRHNLESELIRTNKLMYKWLKHRYEYQHALVIGETRLCEMILERRAYYNGEATADVYKKEPWNGVIKNIDHMNKLLDADVKLTSLREKIDTFKLLVSICEEMISSLRYRNNSIATILEVRKYESGM